jgi:Ni/Fe-hydrogenase subunit HybB-like protein
MINSKNLPYTVPYLLLAVLVAVGIGVGVVRLINGLGTTTALSDGYPWGLWIVYDVFFVPFSAGAFMILAVTHIYGRREYSQIARPVVLAGFLGELMVIMVLVMDLGRWQQFYNVLIPWYWNIRSFMFQVSICLTIYMAIMLLEIAPVVLERFKWHRPLRLIKTVTVLIAAAGIVLSSLHQSSLGSLFLLMPYKLHALWWTPLLPLLFFASAVFAGLSMAIFVAAVSFRAFGRTLDLGLLAKLAQAVAFLLGIYLALKLGDLLVNRELGLIASSGWLGLLFLAEILIGVVVPLILFSIRKVRESSSGLVLGSACVLVGLGLNRTNVALVAQKATAGSTYFPHWMEVVISIAAIAAGILIFALAVHFLPILPRSDGTRLPRWSRSAMIMAGGALSVLTILVVLLLQPVTQAEASRHQLSASESVMLAAARQPRSRSCVECHLDPEALAAAGAEDQALERLLVEPQPPETAHGRLDCVTCHYGQEPADDLDAIHAGIHTDPTGEDAHICVACHQDLPAEFPEDRLRTPHDQVTHGEASGVACSDCHGGVGHRYDPVSGEIICPMVVCQDCHESCELDPDLRGCDACHLAPHEAVAGVDCCGCHRSTETWQAVTMADHPLALEGRHAQVPCAGCHQAADLSQVAGVACADCHEAPAEPHYGATCEDCHTPSGFGDARLPAELHPVALVGAHQTAPCAGCHSGAQATPTQTCGDCHERPADHLSGPCNICHTPEGWVQSIAFVVDLAPRISHELAGREECLICHDLAGQIMPAPSNHGDYNDAQCVLCHKLDE